jgi:hypothetical protein
MHHRHDIKKIKAIVRIRTQNPKNYLKRQKKGMPEQNKKTIAITSCVIVDEKAIPAI